MNTIASQEIKRRGIAAIDEKLAEGPVHVIKNNKPQYVIISEEQYAELVAAASDAYIARVRASLEDVKEGRLKKFKNAKELLKAIEEEE
jgi:PHD/YefM family antitoxin component YafN of YafNO toxin-antitoxin module